MMHHGGPQGGPHGGMQGGRGGFGQPRPPRGGGLFHRRPPEPPPPPQRGFGYRRRPHGGCFGCCLYAIGLAALVGLAVTLLLGGI